MLELQLRSLRQYVQAFNRHDAKAIAALYAEEAAFVERGERCPPDLPPSKRTTGATSMRSRMPRRASRDRGTGETPCS